MDNNKNALSIWLHSYDAEFVCTGTFLILKQKRLGDSYSTMIIGECDVFYS